MSDILDKDKTNETESPSRAFDLGTFAFALVFGIIAAWAFFGEA